MKIAFIGAGRLAQALAAAFSRVNIEVAAVFNRTTSKAETLAASAGGCKVCDTPQQAADMADLVFITVTDDMIGTTASQVRWRHGQCVVHCSGATEVAVLEPAASQGAAIGGFHPLQLFADPAVSFSNMAGSSVAIEAQGALEAELSRIAELVGYRVIRLPPGVRGRYHAATNYAASFLLSLLREACDIWNSFGVNDHDALDALMPLARGALDAVEAKGLAGAIAGPISRGDVSVVSLHLRELAKLGDPAVDFYRSVALRQLRLARDNGNLEAAALERLELALRRS
ncbi:DUF2520 domain-containing protein [Ottowia caeni]|uniref:Rossmann-like and DUF2520 domain-containing protein n=1 Tax=Ottowia caeni TaxID=2870339 RepID=UPI001E5F6142|nr:DUF2520 domain-containing protein [Ottowia caeni]